MAARHLTQPQPGRATLADQARFHRNGQIALALHRRRARPVEPPDYLAIAGRTLASLDLKTMRRSDIAYTVAKASHDAMNAFVERTCKPLRDSVREREQRRWEAALGSMSLGVDLLKPRKVSTRPPEVYL